MSNLKYTCIANTYLKSILQMIRVGLELRKWPIWIFSWIFFCANLNLPISEFNGFVFDANMIDIVENFEIICEMLRNASVQKRNVYKQYIKTNCYLYSPSPIEKVLALALPNLVIHSSIDLLYSYQSSIPPVEMFTHQKKIFLTQSFNVLEKYALHRSFSNTLLWRLYI